MNSDVVAWPPRSAVLTPWATASSAASRIARPGAAPSEVCESSAAAPGTAPSLQGKNVANPLAMILAAAALLSQTSQGAGPGRAIREAALEAVAQGVKTADLGGHSTTSEFTDEVVRRTRTKLEVWSTL